MNQPIRIRRTPKEEALNGTKMSRGTKMTHEGSSEEKNLMVDYFENKKNIICHYSRLI